MEGDFRSTAPLVNLRQRAALLCEVRRFFDQRGFFEVETPLLSSDTVVDEHIEPVQVEDASLGKRPLWLQTSPEFGMKRLLASGAQAIYQIAKCFRGGESGAVHNPEFTMIEWYRVGDDYSAGMTLLSEFAEAIFTRGPAERVTYRDAFQTALQLDPHSASLETLTLRARERSPGVSENFSDQRDDWLDLLLTECVQPTLGRSAPTILFDYPKSQSALAKTRVESGVEIAERFELFVDGVELANGYHELLDGDTLRRRIVELNQRRAISNKRRLPEESRLLQAMDAGLPPCSGCALGFDRLVMLKVGADSIDQVMPFPFDRA